MERLKQIKHDFVQKETRGLCLDIDETLSWTIGAWVAQLQSKFGNPENLTIDEIISKYRYSQNVSYWQTPEALAWMEEQRNSNDFQEVLPVIEGAAEAVDQLHKIIPIVLYATVRPESVLRGTNNWLMRYRFPEAEILLRPKNIPHAQGNQWKAEVLEYLYPEVAGVVDDNPTLPTFFSENYQGKVYLFDNESHPQQGANVIPCRTWKDVLAQVRMNHQVTSTS